MRKLNVLFIMGEIPYPPHTGAKLRTLSLLKEISKEHHITLLITLGQSPDDKRGISEIKEHCSRLIYIPRRIKKSRLIFYIRLLLNLFSPYPYVIGTYYSRNLKRKISNLVSENKFDLIHCDSISLSLLVQNVDGCPKVLTEHNVESKIWRDYFVYESNLLKKIYIYLQWMKMRRCEAKMTRQFNSCIAVSQQDKELLNRWYKVERISVVPNGVDISYFVPATRPINPYSLVFSGSMDWLPNEDAILYFVSEIFPIIKRREPRVSLSIVGRSPGKKIRRLLEKESAVEITGTVRDIRPYLSRAAIVVVPLRIGGGTRLKILEAMAMGKPIVSTSIGAEGIEVTADKNILLADSPELFANKVIQLFDNLELQRKLEEEGRKFVEEKYDWRKVGNILHNVWMETARYG